MGFFQGDWKFARARRRSRVGDCDLAGLAVVGVREILISQSIPQGNCRSDPGGHLTSYNSLVKPYEGLHRSTRSPSKLRDPEGQQAQQDPGRVYTSGSNVDSDGKLPLYDHSHQ